MGAADAGRYQCQVGKVPVLGGVIVSVQVCKEPVPGA